MQLPVLAIKVTHMTGYQSVAYCLQSFDSMIESPDSNGVTDSRSH